jgi:hypothetical protein
MTTARYEAQTARLYRIGDGNFPVCRFIFGTEQKPNAITMEVADSSGRKRIPLFPKPAAIEELEGMTDAQLGARFKENAALWVRA